MDSLPVSPNRARNVAEDGKLVLPHRRHFPKLSPCRYARNHGVTRKRIDTNIFSPP